MRRFFIAGSVAWDRIKQYNEGNGVEQLNRNFLRILGAGYSLGFERVADLASDSDFCRAALVIRTGAALEDVRALLSMSFTPHELRQLPADGGQLSALARIAPDGSPLDDLMRIAINCAPLFAQHEDEQRREALAKLMPQLDRRGEG